MSVGHPLSLTLTQGERGCALLIQLLLATIPIPTFMLFCLQFPVADAPTLTEAVPSESGLTVNPNGLLTETELPFDLEQQWQDLMSIMETQVRKAGFSPHVAFGVPCCSLSCWHLHHISNAGQGHCFSNVLDDRKHWLCPLG